MGYTTKFEGVLKFKSNVTVAELKAVKSVIGRTHADYAGYIQLKIADDLSGIKWDGTEKFYHSVDAVNFVIGKVREEFPTFNLHGELQAQGEEGSDRWIMRMVDGRAEKVELRSTGVEATCPDCAHTFYVGGEWVEK